MGCMRGYERKGVEWGSLVYHRLHIEVGELRPAKKARGGHVGASKGQQQLSL